MSTSTLLESLGFVFEIVYNSFTKIYELFVERIGTLITRYLSWLPFDLDEFFNRVIEGIESFLGTDITLIGIMLGVGLPIFLVYVFVTWVLNLLP